MTILIIGGVTATGKTSTAKLLHQYFGWDYREADEYHSPENIAKMSAGIPLTDEDRFPWLMKLHETIKQYIYDGKSVILTCSALREIYRHMLLA
ncbi:unnamed protein product, partial [Didymodactylos carnosus]